MAGKERYKREIAMLFPYMPKKEKMFLNNYMQNIEDAEYKELEISGSPAYLTVKNGKTMLIWDNGERSFYLYGSITEEEAIRMANSLVKVPEE